eukprot:2319902-Rhodomonas_salina.2
MLQLSVNKAKSGTKELNYFQSILFSQKITSFMQGKTWKQEMVDSPQHQPAIVVWFEILQRFKGLNDAASTNFVFELGQLVSQSTGSNPLSAREVVAQADRLLTPLSNNFGYVKSFIQYLLACVGAEVIH